MGRKIWPSAFDSGGETAPTPGWSSATGGRSATGRRSHASRSPAHGTGRLAYPGRPMTIDTDLARAVRAAVAGGASSDDFGAIPVPETYVGAYLRAEDAETIGKLPRAEKRPSLALQRRRGADARAGARRGADRDLRLERELQHRLVGDLRAGADVRVPQAPARRRTATASATTCRRTSSARTPAASCCAPAPPSAAGSPATACSCTRTTSRSRSRRATTTRSSTPTSACGASSATSAAWASCASRAATS